MQCVFTSVAGPSGEIWCLGTSVGRPTIFSLPPLRLEELTVSNGHIHPSHPPDAPGTRGRLWLPIRSQNHDSRDDDRTGDVTSRSCRKQRRSYYMAPSASSHHVPASRKCSSREIMPPFPRPATCCPPAIRSSSPTMVRSRVAPCLARVGSSEVQTNTRVRAATSLTFTVHI